MLPAGVKHKNKESITLKYSKNQQEEPIPDYLAPYKREIKPKPELPVTQEPQRIQI